MFQTLGRLVGRKTPSKSGSTTREARPQGGPGRSPHEANKQVFSKVFRWKMPEGLAQEPKIVQIVGSFSHWQPVEMQRDGKQGAWAVTVHQIPGNKTHHYMLLIDGKPTFDHMCDGLAVPHGMMEEQYQVETARGPRVMMLFAQTK